MGFPRPRPTRPKPKDGPGRLQKNQLKPNSTYAPSSLVQNFQGCQYYFLQMVLRHINSIDEGTCQQGFFHRQAKTPIVQDV